MQSALIVGASGQDGRLLGPLLATRGYAVHGWTRTPALPSLRCDCAVVDLLNRAAVEQEIARLSPDEIYYLAAFHHSTEDAVELSAAQLLRRSFDVHLLGLLNVLEAIKNSCNQSRLFYAASSHVFGVGGEDRQNESSPLRPNSAYGISKVAGMQGCQFYRDEEGLFAASGILFNHESNFRKPSFLSQKIVRGALNARRDSSFKLTLGNLEARVDWGYAPDYVEAMCRILQASVADDFVIASGELHSVQEFAEIAFDAVGLNWRRHVTTDASLLKKAAQTLCGDPAKLRAATGWQPSRSFEEMVRTLVTDACAQETAASNVSPVFG